MKYGDTQVRFEFAAHSQTYILTRNSYKKMNKLFKANPLYKSLVKKCGIDKLIFFILEDNDIDLIYYSSEIAFPKFDHTISYDFYFDLSSSQKLQYTFGEALGWFQILSMDKILNHQVTAKDD